MSRHCRQNHCFHGPDNFEILGYFASTTYKNTHLSVASDFKYICFNWGRMVISVSYNVHPIHLKCFV